MAVLVPTSTKIQGSLTWTGTAPGAPGTQTVSGTLSSGIDWSAWFTAVTVNVGGEKISYTNFASGGWEAFVIGLKNATIDLTINQDYAASQVDPTFGIGATFGLGVSFYMDIMPTSAARGTTNPSTVLQVINLGYGQEFSVGQLAAATLTLQPTGLPGRLTS